MAQYESYRICYVLGILIIFNLTDKITCYEKTLRKIVRNQSKMVQRPFDEMSGALNWKNISHQQLQRLQEPVYAHVKTMYNHMHRPKVSSLLTAMESSLMKPHSRIAATAAEKLRPFERVMSTNTLPNISMSIQNQILFSDTKPENTSRNAADIIIENFHKIPSSRFFPSIDENGSHRVEPKINSKESTVVFPDNPEHIAKNESVNVKGLFRLNAAKSIEIGDEKQKQLTESNEVTEEKADFVIEDLTAVRLHRIEKNISTLPKSCTNIKTTPADIDAQLKFSELEIEVPWMTRTHYWDKIFNSRYESLMRSHKWPPLKVILIPRAHVDSIWRKTFEQYHDNSVLKILSNVVKKLQFYTNLTFTWNEVSHLSKWWKSTSQKSRTVFRRLIREGRLEITTGCWVETDEATSHIFGLVHQFIEGHQWLGNYLNYSPKVAWLTNTVTHSPTMAYLLSSSGVTNLVFTNVHYSWEKYLAEYQISDFIWLQNWMGQESPPTSNLNKVLHRIGKDRFPRHAMFAHYLQFNSDGFKACGPDKDVCTSEFNFAKPAKNMDINSYNIKEKSELLLEQYSKTGTISPHNVIIAPIGGPHRFEFQPEFDYQYNNYLKIADYVNVNRDIYTATIDFGTPSDFFTTIIERHVRYPSLKGDFTNFADISGGSPAYWVGFFTSRPILKIMLRRLESTLRSTEIMFTLAVSRNSFKGYKISNILKRLIKCRETVALLADRNVISGTVTASNLRYIYDKILKTARGCWQIQEVSVSLLSTKKTNEQPYVQKYVYRDGEFLSIFRSVNPGDQIFVFNSLSQERSEVVELYTRTPNLRVIDHNKKDVTIQVNPVWKYNSDNVIMISRKFFKVTFAVIIPPLTLELFKVKETHAIMENTATVYCNACLIEDIATNGTVFPFHIHPIESGDIQLESYKHRLVFDEYSGFLKAVIEKDTNIKKILVLDYGAFRSSDKNSGPFLFNTNVTNPLHDILKSYKAGTSSKIVIIVSGQITTEFTSVYGRLLQHSVKIFNLINNPLSKAIYIESRADLELSPKNRDLELFMSIQTDIANGNPPEMYTDNNGFQFTARVINISRRVESNVYPMTTMSYIQDRTRRLTFITDHAQGVTALQEGQLIVMLDRRILFDDGRGTGEGLADSSATYHRHYILLENFMESLGNNFNPMSSLYQLPSFRANYLSNTLNYPLDLFVINKTQTERCQYTFLPLIKSAFPCDISLLNFRVAVNVGTANIVSPTTALMILHRQSFSCQIDYEVLVHCDLDTRFIINDILRDIKLVYRTNLGGTDEGTQLSTINLINFPAMELLSLRIVF